MEKYVLVELDDWAGIYVAGELQMEGHRISVQDALDIADVPLSSFFLEGEAADDEISLLASLPKNLDDIRHLLDE